MRWNQRRVGLKSKARLRAWLTATLCVFSAAAGGQQLPQWELGLGLGAVVVPHYRGAADGRGFALPFPYFQYRGKYLKVDDDGVHGRLFRSPRVKLDLSLAGGVPVSSEDDGPRAGMPDLDPTAEIGPALEVMLWRHPEERSAVWLRMPLRAVYSVSFERINHQGWVFAPFVEYVNRNGTVGGPWAMGLSVGPVFADERYHDYFYEVPTAFAGADRPAYDASAGYGGSRVTLTLQKRVGPWWFGAFARVDSLHGATFRNSPLVETNKYYALGFAVSRVLAVSKKSVAVIAE